MVDFTGRPINTAYLTGSLCGKALTPDFDLRCLQFVISLRAKVEFPTTTQTQDSPRRVRLQVELKNKRDGNGRESVGKRGGSLGGEISGNSLEHPPRLPCHTEKLGLYLLENQRVNADKQVYLPGRSS